MKEQDNPDDFVHYIKSGNNSKSNAKCCTWKACCIATCTTWAAFAVGIAITLGVLVGQHYITVTFQDPHHPGNDPITF